MPYEPVKPEQLKTMLKRLQEHIYVPLEPLRVTAWVTPEPVPYAERTSGRRIELAPGDRWGNLWDCAWFRFTGVVPGRAKGAKVVLLIDVNGELCLVDEEGTPVQGLTTVNSEFDFSLGLPGKRVVPVSDPAEGGEVIDLWGDAGCNDLFGNFKGGTLKEAWIAVCREEVRQLYYDAEVLLETAEVLPAGSARRARILQALYEASLVLTELTDERVGQARRILGEQLAKRGGDPVLTISAIGHAHIDLAWLWPIRETIRKGARTFATALRMMERYPDYVFGASQPQLYEWIKRYYPKLFEQIRQRVKEGRWEPQGAMWVESDTNLPGGESLVRQILYGKRFFLREFGQDVRTLWMPDVFGYTASLPQLLKKSGVDYMMTQKLSWSAYNRHPHHTFMWEGIDGSKVLTHMPPEDTYNSPAAPRSIAKAETAYLDKNVSEHCLMLFGIGDGGGGPGEEHLERLAREKNLLGLSPVVQRPSSEFFELLKEGADRYQTWSGELYLEKHQGTLTSQARNKRYNRKMEKALREAEFAAVLAGPAGLAAGFRYPAQELEEIWKEVLLYQFHDILPGSSIKRVYDESLARYAVLLERVNRIIGEAYGALAARLHAAEPAGNGELAEGGEAADFIGNGEAAKGSGAAAEPHESGKMFAVFNSLPWERNEWVNVDAQWMQVRVPSMGYAVVSPDHPAGSAAGTGAAFINGPAVSPDSRTVENEVLSVTFGPDGFITSIYDKQYKREIVPEGGKANELVIYPDSGDAWDFRRDFRETGGTPIQLTKTDVFRDGPQAGFIHHFRFGESTLRQKAVLTAGSRRIDFITHVDWRESGKMLRTLFPVNIRTGTVNCEIQFGYLGRPTHRNTMWDYAKDEICAHQWADLSEPDYGVALLNDCKYGHRAEGNVLDLNLLRSPSYPDPEADRAEHDFTYALYPHPGNHVQAEAYKRGYELNVPLQVIPVPGRQGREKQAALLPAEHSFLRLDHPHVMAETVKKAEDSEDIIVRLYETAGTHAQTVLHFGFAVEEAWICDLMENIIEPVQLAGGKAELSFSPFEIVTLRLKPEDKNDNQRN